MSATYVDVLTSKRKPKPLTRGQQLRHNNLCSLMREARLAAELTLPDMAEKTGMSYGWLSAMELGEKGRTGGGANGRFVGVGVDLVYAYEDACNEARRSKGLELMEHGTLLAQAGYTDLTLDDIASRIRVALANQPAVASAMVAALEAALGARTAS